MARFVVLRHDCPDGSAHYDWMIERTDPAADPGHHMLTFRVAVLPTRAEAFEAERIADHRAAYLDFEGAIPGGRGSVARVDAGEARIETLTDARILVCMAHYRLEGRSHDGLHWRFSRTPDGALASGTQTG